MKKLTCLLLLCAFVFSGCGSADKKKTKEAAATKKEEAKTTETENGDVSFQAFVSRLRKAVDAKDVDTIASMMTPDFAFVMGKTPEGDRKGEGVFQYWEENGLWPELAGILSEKFASKGDYMVAPPQFANEAVDYDGYRAGLRRVNGSWKFAYFVNG